MNLAPVNPNQNNLLAVVPDEAFARLSAGLELVELRVGDVLCESGRPLAHAYFPVTAILSLHYLMETGASAEVAGIGREGMLGIASFMGGITSPQRVLVQTSGAAYRLRAELLMAEFNRFELLMRLLLRYTQALLAHVAQTAVCNRHHSIEQQLCRWILLTLDRMPSSNLIMTQELIATMLGVRRVGVTEAAGTLRDLGVISYRRGHITVLNRDLLAVRACECYQVVKHEFDRLLCDARRRDPAGPGARARA